MRSDVATCPDESSSPSERTRIREEINTPSIDEPEISLTRPLTYHPLPSTLVVTQSTPEPRDDAAAKQLLPNKTEVTSAEAESTAEDPVIAELRGMRSQIARLQMQMEEMAENNVGSTESPPMYDQVARRGAN